MYVWSYVFNYYFVSFVLGILVPYLLYRLSTRNHSYWMNKNIPFVKPYPFLGSFFENFSNSFETLDLERYKKLGKIYGFYETHKPTIIIAEPDLLRDILLKDFQYFPARRKLDMNDDVLNNMLSTLEGEDWKRVRSIITPSFSTGKLKRILSIFQDCAKTLIKNFTSASKNNEPLDVLSIYGAFTMDIITSSAFSTKIDSHNDPENIFIKKAKLIFNQSMNIRFFLFLMVPKLMKKLGLAIFPQETLEFFKNTVVEIIRARKKTKQVRNDFLQLLLDSANEMAKEEITEDDSEDIAINYKDDSLNHSVFKNISTKQISMDELIAQCIIFFLAGYHTTATALAISTYMLAIHQDEQNKVFQELSAALQETNGEVTYEALQKMKHLDNVISETMRLYPPATRTERRAEADYTLKNTDITIPKGMIVTIPMYAMHRDPIYFPNPEKFDPDRFLSERREQIIPYSYLPFGAGPRNCVGMRFALLEIKLCLVYVLSIFKVEKSSLTKVPLEFNRGAGLLRPKPIFIRLTKRDDPPIKI